MKHRKTRLKLPLQPTDATKQSFKVQTPTTVTCRYRKSEHSRLFTIKTQGFYHHFKFASMISLPKIYRPWDIDTNYSCALLS